MKTKQEIQNKLKEIEYRLYSLNAQISLKWIGMRQTPKEIEITLLNRALGEIIKQISTVPSGKPHIFQEWDESEAVVSNTNIYI